MQGSEDRNRYMLIFRGSYATATYGAVNGKDGIPIEDEFGNVTYQLHQDQGGDTPAKEIGKCSAI